MFRHFQCTGSARQKQACQEMHWSRLKLCVCSIPLQRDVFALARFVRVNALRLLTRFAAPHRVPSTRLLTFCTSNEFCQFVCEIVQMDVMQLKLGLGGPAKSLFVLFFGPIETVACQFQRQRENLFRCWLQLRVVERTKKTFL